MGKFYLDMEFTNGNYYLADILEIALVAEESGYAFHSYVKIHYSVPKRVSELTNITNKIIKTNGCPFRDVMIRLVEFLQHEQAHSDTIPIIIAHGGYLHDFPILLASCMKYKYYDFTTLAGCIYVDSMRVLREQGYERPGLDALCVDLNIERKSHSALEDAKILMAVCNRKSVMFEQSYGYTFNDIVYHLNIKLPIPIQDVYNLAVECTSYQELTSILYDYVTPKTALNLTQVCKIAYWYFKDRYLYCN